MRTLAIILGTLSTLSFSCWGFNSHIVESTPSEFINSNAQINYHYYNTSLGDRPARIKGLVGIIDGYAILKLSCANNGAVSVKHNVIKAPEQHVSIDHKQLKTTLSQFNYSLSSQEQITQLKQGRYLQFSQQPTLTANLKLKTTSVSLQGFTATYDRMKQLCAQSAGLAMR
ncbi:MULTISPECIES: hypothetical protein [unclassified Agarivorans]|uniref:hypothetical protein n=1 Tax=unclassified Agarivorans TaxID=2636026 RepID=UPI0026E3EBF0|nr:MULTISPECIES: hypothetical protein [unclassified Agarivorans]MDO6685524.1 hypothetical protein [Agarivorans sp. 3_MG-2023]MDO6715910.1 hypothetical protein [Agarivorans sp. 2_MG-2023]MDO6764953.1 hypothetical protein [Agarivorans sp. 1_MG-2023]